MTQLPSSFTQVYSWHNQMMQREITTVEDPLSGDLIVGSTSTTRSSSCGGSSCFCTFHRVHVAITQDGLFNWSSGKTIHTQGSNCPSGGASTTYSTDDILFIHENEVLAGGVFRASNGSWGYSIYYPQNASNLYTYWGSSNPPIVIRDGDTVKNSIFGIGDHPQIQSRKC